MEPRLQLTDSHLDSGYQVSESGDVGFKKRKPSFQLWHYILLQCGYFFNPSNYLLSVCCVLGPAREMIVKVTWCSHYMTNTTRNPQLGTGRQEGGLELVGEETWWVLGPSPGMPVGSSNEQRREQSQETAAAVQARAESLRVGRSWFGGVGGGREGLWCRV